MARKISQLPLSESVTDDDIVPIVTDGTTKRVAVSTLLADVGGGAAEHAATHADLKALTGGGSARRHAVLGGYNAQGDGGGGTFIWDDTSSTGDNGGTIIVPTGSSTGRWVRLWSGRVNVKWFGAVGDGIADDTAAIQAAIDVTTETKIVEFPAGQYRVVPPDASSAALEIRNSNAILQGIGSSAWPVADGTAPTIIVDAPSPSGGLGILIERVIFLNTADQSAVRNLNFVSGSNMPQAFIVVHAQQVWIDGCSFNGPPLDNLGRWGVVFESGDGARITPTYYEPGVLIITDFWRLTNCTFNYIGNSSVAGVPTGDKDPLGADGCAVLVVGSDSQGGYAHGLLVNSSNVAYCDSSLSGNTWVQCYGQVNALGFYSSNNYSQWIGCASEDYESTNFAAMPNVSVVGGPLSFLVSGTAGGPNLRLGPYSAIRCRAISSTGDLGSTVFNSNGYNQDDPLAGWTVINAAGTGFLIWRRTSDTTTSGSYGDLDDGWWGLTPTTTDLEGLTNYAFLVSDADTTGPGTGWTWFPRGFYLGAANININRISVTPLNLVGPAYPASAGTNGDVILNTAPDNQAATESLLSWTYTPTQGWVGVEGVAVLKGTSVNAASVNLTNSLGNEIVLDTSATGFAYMITARVWAVKSDTTVSAGVYRMLVARTISGTLTIDTDAAIIPDATLNAAGYTFAFSAPSGTTLRVACAGLAGTTVKFRAHLDIQRVSV